VTFFLATTGVSNLGGWSAVMKALGTTDIRSVAVPTMYAFVFVI